MLHLKALMFLYAFEESVDCRLLSSFCDNSNLHISLFKYVLSTMGVSKESIRTFLIGNRFQVKLRILSPYSNRIFLLKICWSIPCLHPSWKVHTFSTVSGRYRRSWGWPWPVKRIFYKLTDERSNFTSSLKKNEFHGTRMVFESLTDDLTESMSWAFYPLLWSCAKGLFNGNSEDPGIIKCISELLLLKICKNVLWISLETARTLSLTIIFSVLTDSGQPLHLLMLSRTLPISPKLSRMRFIVRMVGAFLSGCVKQTFSLGKIFGNIFWM